MVSNNVPPPRKPFPTKLHELLNVVERNGQTDIISWTPDGKSFKVHDKMKFSKEIMPDYFGSKNFKTLHRSLNLWGFKSIISYFHTQGHKNTAQYHHPLFVRTNPSLCMMMRRVRITGTGKKRGPSPSPSSSSSSTSKNLIKSVLTSSRIKEKASSIESTVSAATNNEHGNRGGTITNKRSTSAKSSTSASKTCTKSICTSSRIKEEASIIKSKGVSSTSSEDGNRGETIIPTFTASSSTPLIGYHQSIAHFAAASSLASAHHRMSANRLLMETTSRNTPIDGLCYNPVNPLYHQRWQNSSSSGSKIWFDHPLHGLGRFSTSMVGAAAAPPLPRGAHGATVSMPLPMAMQMKNPTIPPPAMVGSLNYACSLSGIKNLSDLNFMDFHLASKRLEMVNRHSFMLLPNRGPK